MFQEFYDRFAKVYDLVYGMGLEPGIRKSIALMELKPRLSLLEVGIGTGLTLPFLPRDIDITGIDVSGPMLAQCKKKLEEGKYTNVRVEEMSALDMSYPDNSFDRVFAPSVLSVIPDPEEAVAEMLRVCKPDGYVCVVGHFAGDDFINTLLDKATDPVTRTFFGFRTQTSARIVENAPDGLVVKKRPVTKLVNFSTVYLLRKTARQ